MRIIILGADVAQRKLEVEIGFFDEEKVIVQSISLAEGAIIVFFFFLKH